MYFSKISLLRTVSPRDIFKHYLGKNIYKYHQLMWELLGENNPDKKRDFLYRHEFDGHWPVFYVLSTQEPEEIPKEGDKVWEIETKTYNPKIILGAEFYFSLRVNPRVCKTDSVTRKSVYHDVIQHKLYPLRQESIEEKRKLKSHIVQEEGLKWLDERSEKNGFKLTANSTLVEAYEQHQISKNKTGQTISLSTIDFRGRLTVIDPEKFREALFQGIGPAKGFGCGFLMIKR
jgi:CRISPR system Cascade subunit CasE